MATIRDRYVLDIDTKGAKQGLAGVQGSLGGIVGKTAGIAALGVALFKLGGIANTAVRELETINNQLRLVTKSTEELTEVQNRLRQTAIATRSTFAETADLFVKLKLSTDELGISQDRLLNVTAKFQQALAISGADANTAAGAIRQFGQAMASGTVRGDEFNSIVEALGPALIIMSKESGVSVGELRRLSQAGELTAEKFFDMIENSKGLSRAFNNTNATTEQLEQQLVETFKMAVQQSALAEKAASAYKGVLKGIIDILEDIAGLDRALESETFEALFAAVKDGTLDASAALDELKEKLADIYKNIGRGSGRFFITPGIQEAIDLRKEQIKVLQDLVDQQTKVTKADEKAKEALGKALAPFKEFIKAAQTFVDTDYRTELEKANQRVIDAEILIQQLRLAFEVTNGKVDNFVELLRGAQNELDAAQKEVKSLTDAAAELGREGTFNKFFEDLITSSQRSSQEVEFAVRAQSKLKEELQAGRISVDEYAFALEGLKSVLGDYSGAVQDAAEDTKRILEQSRAIIDGLNESTSDAQFEFDSLNMSPLKKDIAEIKRDINRDLTQEIKRLQEAMTPENAAQIKSQIELVKQASAEAIRTQTELAERTFETQRSFQYGWSEAFKSYEDDATNAAKNAERIFDKTTKGMEDMIVTFAKTGKFEFKSFVASILEDLLRAQIQQSISNIFKIPTGGGTAGGGLGDIFGGFFANGGFLPGGKLGIVGEAGPELISGPAQITPLSGVGGNVTYNINAVDSMSFKQMVARDPGFIHAVANQGAKAIPGGR